MLHLKLTIRDDGSVSLQLSEVEAAADEPVGATSIAIPIPLDSGANLERALDVAFESIKVLFAKEIGVKTNASFMDRHTAALIRSIAGENEDRASQGDKKSQLMWAKAILVGDQSSVTDVDFRRACDLLDSLVLDGNSDVERFVREELPALKWLRDESRKRG